MNKTCIEKKIEYKYGDTIKLKPFFDVHYGNTLCDIKAFKTYLNESDDKTYFFGGGDLLDSIVVTDKRYSKSMDKTETETIVDDQVSGLYDILKPYKDRIISLGIGNHEYTIVKNCSTNPIKRLCEKLEVPYAGYSSFFKLIFNENNSRGRTVTFYYSHGYGGGSRTQGGNLTKFSKATTVFDADCYLFGHVHQLQYDSFPYLGIHGNKLVSKKKYICICGTFKKALAEDDTVTWEETKGFNPSYIGGLVVSMKPSKVWVDIKISE
jgi:hypothetical protein